MRPTPNENRLLAALPVADLKRWMPQLEAVEMKLGQELYGSGTSPKHAYFPATAIVSLLHEMASGSRAEVALVGNDGLIGLPIFMGGASAPGFAVVRHAGWAFRLNAEVLKDECARAPSVLPLLLRYAQALMTQMAQTAICNRRHSLSQQLCRRLLLCLDRLVGNEIAITHEQIADMLGVRRGGVTECALKLQELGFIRYARGRITVLDRQALEERSCECYAVVAQAYGRLLPDRDGLPR